MPRMLQWYVNRTIDRNPMYDGIIGDIDVHLWRGAYSIEDIRLIKTTGTVPVPLFEAKRVDLAIEWQALFDGELVGRVRIEQPQVNMVDAGDPNSSQTGVGGPWLGMISELFPFRINSAEIHDGAVHFRAYHTSPPVDVYLSEVNASIENLTNVHDDTAPLIATVKAEALAMDHARMEFEMKLDPTSYFPTFQLGVRLLGLDLTRTNDLARAYAAIDFEQGWFDLVIEMNCREGQLVGYVKPLFHDLQVLSLKEDLKDANVLQLFWEALVGGMTELLENQPRNQFGTLISLRGDLTSPRTNFLEIVGNVLRNAFVRAYLPLFHGVAPDINELEFTPRSTMDSGSLNILEDEHGHAHSSPP